MLDKQQIKLSRASRKRAVEFRTGLISNETNLILDVHDEFSSLRRWIRLAKTPTIDVLGAVDAWSEAKGNRPAGWAGVGEGTACHLAQEGCGLLPDDIEEEGMNKVAGKIRRDDGKVFTRRHDLAARTRLPPRSSATSSAWAWRCSK